MWRCANCRNLIDWLGVFYLFYFNDDWVWYSYHRFWQQSKRDSAIRIFSQHKLNMKLLALLQGIYKEIVWISVVYQNMFFLVIVVHIMYNLVMWHSVALRFPLILDFKHSVIFWQIATYWQCKIKVKLILQCRSACLPFITQAVKFVMNFFLVLHWMCNMQLYNKTIICCQPALQP